MGRLYQRRGDNEDSLSLEEWGQWGKSFLTVIRTVWWCWWCCWCWRRNSNEAGEKYISAKNQNGTKSRRPKAVEAFDLDCYLDVPGGPGQCNTRSSARLLYYTVIRDYEISLPKVYGFSLSQSLLGQSNFVTCADIFELPCLCSRRRSLKASLIDFEAVNTSKDLMNRLIKNIIKVD
jgi:hypothetical protein